MERKLSEAAIQGNVESLIQLLQEDPLILDKIIVSCVSDSHTPLHTASILGHVNFVKQLLSFKPDLASEFDSASCSPLHLAAAKGHVEVVKELLRADAEVGSVRNLEGRTALHIAVIKGRVKVVDELVRAKPDLAWVLTDRGETVFHLCVKYNRLEVLKLLTESIKKESELVNWRDGDGNTVLHIAVSKKQLEMINHLLTIHELEVNALNRYSITALDILTRSPRDLRDLDIENSLRKGGGLGVKDLHLITEDTMQDKILPRATKRLSLKPSISAKNPLVKHKHTDWLGRKRSALMVVASLLATVAFQAGLTPPGGVWQDDYMTDENGNSVFQPHIAGTSVMAYKQPREYGLFMIFNTIAFLTSLSIILLLVSGLPLRKRRWMWLQMVTVWIAITFQVCTYFITLRHLSPKSVVVQSTLRQVTEISVLTWLSLMGVVFIGNVIRMNLWILRKYGYIKEKERVTIADEDDEEL